MENISNQELIVKVEGGFFRAMSSQASEYPGVDVEFISDNEDFCNPNNSRPRVLFEKPKDDKIRVLVWADKNDEDYSDEILFD